MKDARYTAKELSQVLSYHGDLPIVISVTQESEDPNRRDPVTSRMYEFRPVLSADSKGNRVLELMVFADDESFTENG